MVGVCFFAVVRGGARVPLLRGALARAPGSPIQRSIWDLFLLMHPRDYPSLKLHGLAPWFANHGPMGGMFRPLSSATIALDAWLSPRNDFVPHLHSFAWWAFFLYTTHRALRARMTAAGCAFVVTFLALGHGCAGSLAWLCNRCLFQSGAFMMLAWEQTAQAPATRRSLITVGIFTMIATCFGEYAVPWGLVLFVLDRLASRVQRPWSGDVLFVALPFSILAFGVQYWRNQTVVGYMNPLHLGELLVMVTRVATLLFMQWVVPFRAIVREAFLERHRALLLLGLVAVFVALARDARQRWQVFGCLVAITIATAPLAIPIPLPRVLLPFSLVTAYMLGCLVFEHRDAWSFRSRASSCVAAVLLVLSMVEAHRYAIDGGQVHRRDAARFKVNTELLSRDPGARFMVLNSAFVPWQYAWFQHIGRGGTLPVMLPVTNSELPVVVQRIDAHTLRIAGPSVVSPTLWSLYRAPGTASRLALHRVADVSIEVVGPPFELRVRADRPFEETRWRFYRARGETFEEVPLVPIHGAVLAPP